MASLSPAHMRDRKNADWLEPLLFFELMGCLSPSNRNLLSV
jgi:hypothetical protein